MVSVVAAVVVFSILTATYSARRLSECLRTGAQSDSSIARMRETRLGGTRCPIQSPGVLEPFYCVLSGTGVAQCLRYQKRMQGRINCPMLRWSQTRAGTRVAVPYSTSG